jgi:hypothetical protein
MRATLLLLFALVAIAAAPAAAADGPMFATQGGAGASAGDYRYVAVAVSGSTALEVIRRSDGVVSYWTGLKGYWGLPTVGSLSNAGLSRDGRTLVVEQIGFPARGRFLVIDTKTLRIRKQIKLPGAFSVDALSPDASRLFLIQYLNRSIDHYVVRAYDLRAGRLLPGRIADRTQRSWEMQGTAVTRTVSPGGRWVFTLYTNPGGYPFVHALDTVRSVAHCVGLPFTDQSGISGMRLRLDGGKLLVHADGTGPYVIDPRTWRLSHPQPAARAAASFPWPLLAGSAVAAILLLAAAAYGLRRKKASQPESRSRAASSAAAPPRSPKSRFANTR